MVNEAAIKEGQQQTKQLHAVVAAHGRARKELQQAQLARFHLHNAWRGFLSQAVTQLAGVQCTIPGPGKADERKSDHSYGSLGSSQRKPCKKPSPQLA